MNKLFSSQLAHLPKHGPRVILAVALLSVALLLGTFSFAPAAHAATYTAPASQVAPAACTTWNPSTTGGEAHWTRCINPGSTVVVGWVKDTKADGKCAQVYAIFTNGATRFSALACPNGTIKTFSWSVAASGASVYLRVF